MASEEPGDDVERAWNEVERAWDDDDAHKRFVILADASGRLAEAGRRYREVKERDAGRRAEAERRIDAVMVTAMAQLRLTRDESAPTARRRIEWVGLGVSAALIAAALYQIIR